jgi:hypothetical protein
MANTILYMLFGVSNEPDNMKILELSTSLLVCGNAAQMLFSTECRAELIAIFRTSRGKRYVKFLCDNSNWYALFKYTHHHIKCPQSPGAMHMIT